MINPEYLPLLRWTSLALIVCHAVFAILTALSMVFHLNFAVFLLAVPLTLLQLFGLYSYHKENFQFMMIYVGLSAIMVLVDGLIPVAPHSLEYGILITVLGVSMIYTIKGGEISVEPV